jgi:hypothetical protein
LPQAMDYYDQASPGLGLEFLSEVERTVQRILLNPEAWTKVSAHLRSGLLQALGFWASGGLLLLARGSPVVYRSYTGGLQVIIERLRGACGGAGGRGGGFG